MKERSAKFGTVEVVSRLTVPAHKFKKLPSPTTPQIALCTDEAAGKVLVVADGEHWRRVHDGVIATEAA